MRALLLSAAGVALSGCVIVSDVDVPGPAFDGPGAPERLYAAAVEPAGVRIRVASGGCTSEESFDVDVNRIGPPGAVRYFVRFDRDTEDNCEAFLPDGVELFFSNERMGLPEAGRITVSNPIGR